MFDKVVELTLNCCAEGVEPEFQFRVLLCVDSVKRIYTR